MNLRLIFLSTLLIFCSQNLHAESKINPKEINPLILEELSVWISDTTDFDDFVAIQLDKQFDRNRFFIGGDRIYCGANEEKKNCITYSERSEYGDTRAFFSYSYAGTIHNDIHVYRTFSNGGGSLTSRYIMFVRIVKDFGHDIDYRTSSKNENDEDEYNLYLDGRERHLIYKVGEIGVGFNEKFLKLDGNDIVIGHYESKYDPLEDTIKVSRIITKFKDNAIKVIEE
jgi:hypothetical protein